MATYHTVDGQPYSVTAGTAVTVTDSDGLVLSVKAGEQGVFVGNGGDATVTGEHHIVQVKGGFAVGGGGGGGGGEPFDGHLNADLVIGSGVTGTRAEWTVHLGSLTSQGCLEESTTGYGCCVGVKPNRDARELVEDINTESSLGLIVEAVYVSETEIRLVARRAGDYANAYSISANDAGEPGVESPCFGRGPVDRTVDGRTDAPATSYSATLNGEKMLSAADVDAVPMLYSMNPVSSDGVRRKLAGKASLADSNVFAGCNVFNGDASFSRGAAFNNLGYQRGCGLYNYNGDLYWGCTKLNGGGGDVYADGDNTFTGCNTFDSGVNFTNGASFYGDVSFSCGTSFYGSTIFNNGVGFNDLGYKLDYGLYNYNGDLYWGCTKLGGGVSADGDNVFTGDNTFNGVDFNDLGYQRGCGLYNYNGDLYWGTTKLNGGGGGGGGGDVYAAGDNTFTGCNTFDGHTQFNCRVDLNGVDFNDLGYQKGSGLYNYNGNLYWGNTKLNGGGDVYTTRSNVFTGVNTFDNCTYFNGVNFNNMGWKVGSGLYNYNGNLYWGNTKLNGGGGGGDVYSDGDNVFTGINTFNRDAYFNSCSFFYGSASFNDIVSFNDLGVQKGIGLYNYNCDLYWGNTKLNGGGGGGGGGDVYTDRDNVFTGDNYFNKGLYLPEYSGMGCNKLSRDGCGNLYWGCTKLNGGGGGGGGGDVYADGDNVFTGANTFSNCTHFNGAAVFYGNTFFSDCAVFRRRAGFYNLGYQMDCGLYAYNNNLYWGRTKLSDGGDVYASGNNVFTGANTFNGDAYFNGSSTYFNKPPHFPYGLYLDCGGDVRLANGDDGHLYFRDARLDSSLHNPATSGGTVQITIGQKSLVLDCSKLQRLIDLLEQQ